MAAPVFRRQRQPDQGPDRGLGAQHGVGQLEQRVAAPGQAAVEVPPEPAQHLEVPGRLDAGLFFLQNLCHGTVSLARNHDQREVVSCHGDTPDPPDSSSTRHSLL